MITVSNFFAKITLDEKNCWSLDSYKKYIAALSDEVRHRYEFILELVSNQFNGALSLHDSWVESISIIEKNHNEESNFIEIGLTLLGPYHDNRFIFRYKAVSHYECNFSKSFIMNIHGDLIVNEFIILDDYIKHKFLFSNDGILVIEAKDCVVEIIPVL